MRKSCVLALLFVLALAGVACSVSEGHYGELLGLVPDTPETRSYVIMTDFISLREAWDIPALSMEADEGAAIGYLDYYFTPRKGSYPTIGSNNFINGYPPPTMSEFLSRKYLAFDLRNVDYEVVSRLKSGRFVGQLEVVSGRFDPEATDKALNECTKFVPNCEPPLRAEHRGVAFYSWGKDFWGDLDKTFAPPIFDQSARGSRITVQDDYVFRSISTKGMEEFIDASQGRRSSLGDVEEFRLMAKEMEELGAYTMLLTDTTQAFEEWSKSIKGEMLRELEDEPMLRPYLAFATGEGKDESGPYTALVLIHSDGGSANANVALLRRRIEETKSWYSLSPWAGKYHLDADKIEIRAKGRILLAKLPSTRGNALWIQWALNSDPLLLHE